MFKKVVGSLMTVAFMIGMSASFSGCNTIKGVGEDVERGGQKLENASDNVKK
jgi:entericidin B